MTNEQFKNLKVGDRVIIGKNGFRIPEGKLCTVSAIGYRSAYISGVYIGDICRDYENLELPTGLKAMRVGDILVDDEGNEAMVVDVRERVFTRSCWGNFGRVSCQYTYEEAEKYGWKIKGKEEVKEMTVSEVAKELGFNVKIVK